MPMAAVCTKSRRAAILQVNDSFRAAGRLARRVGGACSRGGGATGEWAGTAALLLAPTLPYIKSVMKRSQRGSLIHTSRS